MPKNIRTNVSTFGPPITSNFNSFDIRHGVDDDAPAEWRRLDMISEGRERVWKEKQKLKADLIAAFNRLPD